MTLAWLKRWGPALLIMAIIFIASSTPESDLPKFGIGDFVAKKGGHMIGYALLAAAYFHALDRHRNTIRAQFLAAAFLALLYAASDELHQKFIPGRTPSLSDILVDMSGALIGLAILSWNKKKSGIGSQESEP